jgi:hypothetical protein
MLCDANVRYGRERAAASVFGVADWFEVVGDAGTSGPFTNAAVLCDEPCLDVPVRLSCSAFARAFSMTSWR